MFPMTQELQRMGVMIPKDGYRTLKKIARRQRISLSEYVRVAIEEKAARDGATVDLTVLPAGTTDPDPDDTDGPTGQ